jgi:bifunctional DNA-binding transcriptional regulator/antitoxin component of YhaV-PrlF toxin-antitoxin module
MEMAMMESMTVQMAQRGVLVLPKKLRDTYNLKPGDRLTLLDLDGVFVLSRRPSEVDVLAGRIASTLGEQGESLESMLQILREERERYGDKAEDLP